MSRIIVEGCPVADNQAACPRCGGGWPGTQVTTEAMTRAVNAERIDPDKLGCGVLQTRATEGLLLVAIMNGTDLS